MSFSLGSTLANYAVLAGATVTNTGPTTVNGGNVGLSPGTSITGFPSGSVTAPWGIHKTDASAAQAQIELTLATVTIGVPGSTPTVGTLINSYGPGNQDLVGLTLTPGVYDFASSASLSGVLTLDGTGQYFFRIGSTLTTAGSSSILLINGASACNVFWNIGSSATLGTNSTFVGNILAYASITATTGPTGSIKGSLLARIGAVTLDNNRINNSTCVPSGTAPAPAIRCICPKNGCYRGKAEVQIKGTGFLGATSVTFGGYPAIFVVNSDTSITALSPPYPSGKKVDIIVSNLIFNSAVTCKGEFSYFD